MEVKTEDGKFVKAFVPVPEIQFVEEQRNQAETHEPTPQQKLRLQFLMVIGVVLLIFFVLLMILWFTYFFRKPGKPPKLVDDMFKFLVTGMVGAFLGFVSSPTGDTQIIPKPPRTLQPSKTNPQRTKSAQPPE